MVTDDRLRETLARDVDAAFETLVLAYQDRLYTFALRYTGCTQDAEETAQDALIRAYRALTSYSCERIAELALRPWLYRITLNVARNRARGRRGARDVHGEEAAFDTRPDPDGSAEAMAERAEQGRELEELVATLPARYRAALVLRHVEGLGYGDIAVALGRPVGTVKSDVHRGIALLRAALLDSREQP